ncbi:MAG: GNAT family N-acetyltransferase [Chloroflexi bacterium]|nr:MAG: GNAT family N-acetyltransferase [Chloroflexota bacterium]
MRAAPAHIALRPFTATALATVRPWFDDAETSRWLGGRDWPENLLRLVAARPSEHRGSVVRERLGLIASFGRRDVALIDAEVYTDDSAAIALVVAPRWRRRGVGAATLVAVGAYLARTHGVLRLVGGVEQRNTASARCALTAGFVPSGDVPDQEGFVDYVLWLGRPHGFDISTTKQ